MSEGKGPSDIPRPQGSDKNVSVGEKDQPSGQVAGDTKKKFGMQQFWLFLGWLLIIISPLVGAVPGPGFIIIFPIGLALVLKNSLFAKRRYARLAKKYPEYGRWFNWALRRSREEGTPPAPDIWGDIKRIFTGGKFGGKTD